MAKNSIRDYDATAANNTDVQSTDISEGCAASGINNAIREVMADLKDVSTGAVNLETPAADRLDVDNIRIDGNTISSTDTNGDITLDPDGTGKVALVSNVTMTSDDPTITMTDSSGTNDIVTIQATSGALIVTARGGSADGEIIFKKTDGSATDETMRIDSSGNLLVGKTDTSINTQGVLFNPNFSHMSSTSDTPLALNRKTSDGDILNLRKDGTTVGNIGNGDGGGADGIDINGAAGYVGINTGDTNNYGGIEVLSRQYTSAPRLRPATDNQNDLGDAGRRFDDIYATNSTIQTSDQNEKQQIASLTSAEMTAAKAISALFKTFKWNSSVTESGDAARRHAGVIAQEVQTAMTNAGLDAADYAF